MISWDTFIWFYKTTEEETHYPCSNCIYYNAKHHFAYNATQNKREDSYTGHALLHVLLNVHMLTRCYIDNECISDVIMTTCNSDDR
jgi:hypothetical protein